MTLPAKGARRAEPPIYFLHFLNTGGRSFLDILCRPFARREVLSLTATDVRDGRLQVDPVRLKRCRLIHGRFDYDLKQQFPGPVRVVGLLREPLRRTIATYERHFRRRSGPPIEDLLRSVDDNDPWVINPQARRIAGGMHLTRRVISDGALLELAKRHLEEFAFVGLTERFSDSVQLLTYTFGWPPVLDPPDRRPLREPGPETRYQPAVLARIRALTAVDAALYDHARTLFEQRVTAMADDLQRAFRARRRADEGHVRELMDAEQLVASLITRGEYHRAAQICGAPLTCLLAAGLMRIALSRGRAGRLVQTLLSQWKQLSHEASDDPSE